ncbi:hypothetical protein Ab1vBOLIVR4_gp44 [Agrobacterium phage OLIVR4]|nr:hypothetical protein Ab1vBOLIVR4_gp44 [Agrobacterium phage OLIVR4]
MTRIIYKYELDIFGSGNEFIDIKIPAGADILTVDLQKVRHGEMPQLWALADMSKPVETRRIWVFGTGVPINTNAELLYISTVQIHDGHLIMHFFEEIK